MSPSFLHRSAPKLPRDWCRVGIADGVHPLVAAPSGRALDVEHASKARATPLVPWRWTGALNQRGRIEQVSPDAVEAGAKVWQRAAVNGPWSVGGNLYEDTGRRLCSALTSNPGNCVATALWHQGENDRGANTSSAHVEAALRPVIAGLRGASCVRAVNNAPTTC